MDTTPRAPLSGKVAIVTGASSGIGRATAIELAQAGASVALVARSKARLQNAAGEIQKSMPSGDARTLIVLADVSVADDMAQMVGRVHETLGPPDILVNNAGIGHWSSFAELSPERARAIMEVNFFGALYSTRVVLPDMLRRRSGSIVFVSSGLGMLPFPYSSLYSASKHAVNGFAGSLRAEVEPRGIHVLLVMPGGTRTSFFEANHFPPRVLEAYLRQRLDPAESVARRIVSGIIRHKRRVVTGSFNDIDLRLGALFPGYQARLLRRIGRHIYRRESTLRG